MDGEYVYNFLCKTMYKKPHAKPNENITMTEVIALRDAPPKNLDKYMRLQQNELCFW